jgi:hypothetical protein
VYTVPQPSAIPKVMQFADRRLVNVHSHSWVCPYKCGAKTPGNDSTFHQQVHQTAVRMKEFITINLFSSLPHCNFSAYNRVEVCILICLWLWTNDFGFFSVTLIYLSPIYCASTYTKPHSSYSMPLLVARWRPSGVQRRPQQITH